MAMTTKVTNFPQTPVSSFKDPLRSSVKNPFASLAAASPASSQSSASENIQRPLHPNFQCIIFTASAKQDAKYLCGIQIWIFNKEAQDIFCWFTLARCGNPVFCFCYTVTEYRRKDCEIIHHQDAKHLRISLLKKSISFHSVYRRTSF